MKLFELYESILSSPVVLDVAGIQKQFILPERASRSGDEMVLVDTAKFDEEWKKDSDYYIGTNGAGSMKGRYNGFMDFIENTDTGIEVAEVGVLDPEEYPDIDGVVGFTNGRHRFAAMRDLGMKQIPVAMSSDAITIAKKMGLLT